MLLGPVTHMIYDIKISFDYTYKARTAWGYHLLRLRPRDNATQRLLSSHLVVDPVPAQISYGQDFFGNERTIMLQEVAHDHMSIILKATVEVMRAPLVLDFTPPWAEVVKSALAYAGIGSGAPGHFLGASPLVEIGEGMSSLARRAVSPEASILTAAKAVMQAVHDHMRYVPKVTNAHTSAQESFTLGQGVCQDFAHIMIAALRGLGIPAAYASGLIRTIPPNGQARLEGADAMHAWVEVWCGEMAGWIGFDPTNALVVGNDHVLVAIGRDYSDVAPVDGVIVAATRTLHHAVDMVPR